MSKNKKKPEPWTGTKKDLILSLMPGKLVNEIVDAAAARGVKLTTAHVYAVQSLARRKARQAKDGHTKHGHAKHGHAPPSKHPKPAARSRRARRSRPVGRPPARPAAGVKKIAAPGNGMAGLLEGLSAISGFAAMKQLAEQLSEGEVHLDEASLEGTLKASASLIGLPKAIKMLEDERHRTTQAILEALQ